MPLNHAIKLTLGSGAIECDRWDGYTITQSIFEAGCAWSFEIWRSDLPSGAWDVLTAAVRAGDWITLSIDDAPQLVGQIDARSRGGAKGGAKFVLSGRDLAAAAIDSDADPRIHLNNTTFADAASAMLGKIGIKVQVGTDADQARAVQTSLRPGPHGVVVSSHPRRASVGRFHPKLGEKIWGLIQTLGRKVGVLSWPTIAADQTLAIVVDVPNYNQLPVFTLERREVDGVVDGASKILEGWDDVDVAGIPTDVYVSGHSADGDAPHARARAHAPNERLFFDDVRVTDRETFGLRQRWIESPRGGEQDAAEQDAARVLADANRRLRRYRCVVEDHGQLVNGAVRLYAINTVANVVDTVANVNQAFLIERVTFRGSRAAGQTTEMILHPLYQIQLIPDPNAA